MSKFSCFVVGNGALASRCLDILIRGDIQVLGVYSSDGSLTPWAGEHDIEHGTTQPDFQQQLQKTDYDYLFSINNIKWIIPGDILLKARRATINYHDSLLPKYAGLYATSWALIHGEHQHGVTWHEVTSEIDAGAIFKQTVVPVLPDDTAFDLNTRCFDSAIASFSELVQELKADRLQPVPQTISKRTYFSPSSRPAAACLLNFDSPASTLCNLVRGLDFGPVQNPLGLPKCYLPGGIVSVKTATSNPHLQGVPGEILTLDSDGIDIAVLDGAVRLSGFATLTGRQLSTDALKTDYGCHIGDVLPELKDNVIKSISQQNLSLCLHEPSWVQRLSQLAPFKHPYSQSSHGQSSQMPVGQISNGTSAMAVSKPSRISLEIDGLSPDHCLAVFAAYCTRLTPETEFDLALHMPVHRHLNGDIFAQTVPLRIHSNSSESFTQFQTQFKADLDTVISLGSYALDIYSRYLDLAPIEQPLPFDVTLVLATSPAPINWLSLETTLALVAYKDGSPPQIVYGDALSEDHAQAIVSQLQTLIAGCSKQPDTPLVQLPLLGAAEQDQILKQWNQTTKPVTQDVCIHHLIEAQVKQTPERVAVVCDSQQLTYGELNQRANQLAHYLQSQGVGPDSLVGIYMERSLELMVSLLAVHKAGGAYVPLDPDFPPERIQYMLQDCQAPVLLTKSQFSPPLPLDHDMHVVAVDHMAASLQTQGVTNPISTVTADNLSYIIYTSGSTGRPKGVMVEHRNVVNFFSGMDDTLEADSPDTWLAVTSLSFDISVLELFWTLARGFKVVIYDAKLARQQAQLPNADKAMDFSLFYFSSHEAGEDAADKYRLLLEGAKFADNHGFQAVWTPERHFHAFGGLFPNPVVTSAALATVTKQIQLRAGSCVSPLHNPVRLTEDWSVVDNLSQGRVGISFAAGWQPNDFVLQPDNFSARKTVMFDQIDTVQALWRGESVTYPNGKGDLVNVSTLPRPVQSTLPVWITAAGNPETFRLAGAKGFNILTHLLGQTQDELADKIAIYRQAWRDHGHGGDGTVSLMLHTFLGEHEAAVKELVREPMRQYLGSSLNLIKAAAWSFPTFKQKTTDDNGQFSVTHLSDQEWNDVLDFSFERYFETSGLFGTVETCLKKIDQFKGLGVNEVACLIDYGVDSDLVLAQLPLLHQLKEQAKVQHSSLAQLIRHHQLTHLQCTPSMARMLVADADTRTAMGQLHHMLVGGEAFSEALADELRRMIPAGRIHNMYGPTETTIWSTTYTLDDVTGVVPIGKPIANTELYVLDKQCQPVPVGIAGELFIGGLGVTRGYLHRSDLTQERFIPNPFDSSSSHLYRTGDLVRYRADGHLEFIGRSDFQVKVSGYRIELGEIETVLSRHKTVRETVIIAREDQPGDKRLVAYVIPQSGQRVDSALLREYLLNHLPEYMVPSHVMGLEAFPLTPNRKIDRRALPIPEQSNRSSTNIKTAPQSPIEKTLVETWQTLLLISEIGIDENFFELGGNSLIAVQLINRVQSIFDVELGLMDLFRHPTVAKMAQQLENMMIEQSVSDDLAEMIDNLQQLSTEDVMAMLQQ